MKKEYVGPPTDIWASGVLLFADAIVVALLGMPPLDSFVDKKWGSLVKGV